MATVQQELEPRDLVRVDPRYVGGRHSKGRGRFAQWGRAVYQSSDGHSAFVRPLGAHGKTERVPLEAVRLWRKAGGAGGAVAR